MSSSILTAELLSIGAELTVGDTRDTNAGELARSLTSLGVTVGRITAVPDRLDVVSEALRAGLTRADLVISTGGLGPTPDDLTREAIALLCDETPTVDPGLERWLRKLWARRGMPFPEMNLKQAWLIPSAISLSNPLGTAPGWFVRRADRGAVVALPGPPREMRPMWANEALPRLRSMGLGADFAARSFRLANIGESQAAELLGEALLRRANPAVATYARAEAVDVRVSAFGGPVSPAIDGVEEDDDSDEGGLENGIGGAGSLRSAAEHVESASRVIRERLGAYIWATGERTWADAIGERLHARGWKLGLIEIGTAGQVAALLGDVDWLVSGLRQEGQPVPDDLIEQAQRARDMGGCEVGLAVAADELAADMSVAVAVVTPEGIRHEQHMAFLGGSQGRSRAALVAARVLFEALAPHPENGNATSD
ncbi:MAG: competence/damage-inducible protein A [Chloroflexi bacterium]|nr:competence/damage-inducible protein A [Chloroflexota bacterium]